MRALLADVGDMPCLVFGSLYGVGTRRTLGQMCDDDLIAELAATS